MVHQMPYKSKSHAQRIAPQRLKPKRLSSAQAGYGYRWRKLRKWFLKREPLCRECLKLDKVVTATDLDHIVSKYDGGTDDPLNLQPLCKSCHSRKTVLHDGAFGNERS